MLDDSGMVHFNLQMCLGCLAVEGEEASGRLLFYVWNWQANFIGEVWIKSLGVS